MSRWVCRDSPSWGCPDTTCREARDRVRASIQTSGFRWPDQRITVNLAPSSVRKTGAGAGPRDRHRRAWWRPASSNRTTSRASGSWPSWVSTVPFRSVPGALPLTTAVDADVAVVAPGNAPEASLVTGREVLPVRTLAQTVGALKGETVWPEPDAVPAAPVNGPLVDLASVRGQPDRAPRRRSRRRGRPSPCCSWARPAPARP